MGDLTSRSLVKSWILLGGKNIRFKKDKRVHFREPGDNYMFRCDFQLCRVLSALYFPMHALAIR